MGELVNMNASAANMSNDAASTRANAMLARRQAYADAYKLEADAGAAARVAGDNMMTMRRNESANRAAARVAGAISGFAGNVSRELSVAEYFEKAIGDAARSSSIAYRNAAQQAGALRRQADTQYALGNVQAGAYDRMASINRSMAPWMGVGGLLQTGVNVMMAYPGAFTNK